MKLALAQINSVVGDLDGNAAKIADAYKNAVGQGAEIVVFPELALTGYPPRDLLLRPVFLQRAEETLVRLAASIHDAPALVGTVTANPDRPGRPIFNSAVFLRRGMVGQRFFKRLLPTYDVFDEDRYFEPGKKSGYFEWDGQKIGVTICEDIWNDADFWSERRYHADPVQELAEKGCSWVINLSASPWISGKEKLRGEMVQTIAKTERIGVAQCNLVGGNDQLVFDGHSLAINSEGLYLARAKGFAEDLLVVDTNSNPPAAMPWEDDEKNLFDALVLGTRDYVCKCGFKKAIIGLSGGIDSALVAVIAANALGKENVYGVSLPAKVSSQGSLDDAAALAQNIGIKYDVIPVEPIFQSASEQCGSLFAGLPPDQAEENLQSRARGMVLMALSNKFNSLVLTTGNKSELAVGYCTIYGDMCGGLAVISDVPKTRVYALSRWINREREIIPTASITKAPSAELRENQTDQDSLPPYEVLDEILRCYVEKNEPLQQIVAAGFDEATVRDVLKKVDYSEYKRQQAAPGIKVTSRAFGRGRLMPIAQKFREF